MKVVGYGLLVEFHRVDLPSGDYLIPSVNNIRQLFKSKEEAHDQLEDLLDLRLDDWTPCTTTADTGVRWRIKFLLRRAFEQQVTATLTQHYIMEDE